MPGVNIGAIKKWSVNIKKAQPSSLSVPYCHIDRSRNLCLFLSGLVMMVVE